jgi:hypothetical protein
MMEAEFSYWMLGSGGGHDLLSLIPYVLHLHEHKFGSDIRELDVYVHFIPYDVHISEAGVSEIPLFRIIKTTKKLKIEYLSKHLPFDVGYMRGKNILEENGTRGCRRLEKFVREFRDVITILGPEIRKKSDFDWSSLVVLIDEKLKNFPQRDSQLIAIRDEERQRRLESPIQEIEAEPYHSDTLPELIPINRIEDYHSHYMGTYGDGNQFWGRILNMNLSGSEFYVVLHKFDCDGVHLGTDHTTINTEESQEHALEQARTARGELIERLGPVNYGDIAIKLFRVNIDGHVFGLIDSSTEEWGDLITMEPGDLGFHPPWNGDYDT